MHDKCHHLDHLYVYVGSDENIDLYAKHNVWRYDTK
jgi:hypothetical protein